VNIQITVFSTNAASKPTYWALTQREIQEVHNDLFSKNQNHNFEPSRLRVFE